MKAKTFLTKVVSVVMILALLCVSLLSLGFSASAATTYYLRGSMNGWGTSSEYMLTNNGDGTHSITVSLEAGTYTYKIANEDWSMQMPKADATLTLASKSLVKFTIDDNATTYSATPVNAPTADVYVRGTFSDWEVDTPMTALGNNCFYQTVTLPAGTHEYKIATEDWGWSVPDGSANAKLTLDKESQVLFEVSTMNGSFSATPLTGDTNFYPNTKTHEDVTIYSAWGDHADQVLCEKDGKLAYVSTKDANYSSAATKWDFVPTTLDGVDTPVFFIQNATTGNYLYLPESKAGADVLASATGNADSNGKWIVDTTTGNYRFFCAGSTLLSLNTEDQSGAVQCDHYPAFYLSSQFKTDLEMLYDYDYTLYPDRVEDTKGTAKATSTKSITSNTSGSNKTWAMTKDTSASPVFRAPNTPLAEAVYNLSMEETYINMFQSEFGTAFYTGETWLKVWTRDTAMACHFSLANLFPDISLNCAKEKVVTSADGFAVFEEDTGTGGSYPVSTDKIITYLSVWEIYLTTGDESVLDYFYDICMNNIKQDYNTAFDTEAGLMRGETCGLDWRSQTYPDWMGNEVEKSLSNIAEGKAASVNLIYLGVLQRMIETADILDKSDSDKAYLQAKYDALYKAVTERLWHEELGCYASWEYPSYMGSPLAYKIDCIANGYALMYGIGSQEQLDSIAENYPLVTYGANVVYPNKQGTLEHKDRIYHNRGVWPGWEAQLMLAGAEFGYDTLSEEIWNSCITAAATSLTNKEVVDFTTGEGIHVNRQLWSIAATLAGYHKVLFGMIYSLDGLTFEPYVPEWMEGPFYIDNFKYMDATLNLTLEGEGSVVESITVNGENVGTTYTIPMNATGTYDIVIKVVDTDTEVESVNLDDAQNHVICPSLPDVKLTGTTLSWNAQPGCTYKVWDGDKYTDTTETSMTVDTTQYHPYSVVAVAKDGTWSEMSRPVITSPDRIKIEAENCTLKGLYASNNAQASGGKLVTDTYSATTEKSVAMSVTVDEAGQYLLSACYNDYSNNDPNSCSNAAIRSVYVDGKDAGTLVFPVVNYDYEISTHALLTLTKGTHEIKVFFDKSNPYDRNMTFDTASSIDSSVQYDYFTIDKATNLFADTMSNSYILGDANADGVVNIYDATTIQRAIVGLDNNSYNEDAADVDSNDIVNIYDATFIQRYLVDINDNLGINTTIAL